MRPPEGMPPSHWAKLLGLTEARRVAVLERAALIVDGCGVGWPEADARAWNEEAEPQRALFGGWL